MNLLSKKQKVFPQLSFQLLWYMMLQVVFKNGPRLGFVLLSEAQIIVQDAVTFLTAGSERGLWLLQSQGIPSTHFHRVQFSKVPFQCVTSAGSALLQDAIFNCQMLELWPSELGPVCCFSAIQGWVRPGEVSHAWNEAINPVTKLKWKLWQAENDWSEWWPGRVTDSWALQVPVVFHGLLFQTENTGWHVCVECRGGGHMERGVQEALSQLHSQPRAF